MILTPVTENNKIKYNLYNLIWKINLLLTLQKLLKDNSTSLPAVNFVEEFEAADINIKLSAFFPGKRCQSII